MKVRKLRREKDRGCTLHFDIVRKGLGRASYETRDTA